MDRSSVLITLEKCYITHYNTHKHTGVWSVQRPYQLNSISFYIGFWQLISSILKMFFAKT